MLKTERPIAKTQAVLRPSNCLLLIELYKNGLDKVCAKWGEITMDDAQCGKNIKGCAIIENGTKEINLK